MWAVAAATTTTLFCRLWPPTGNPGRKTDNLFTVSASRSRPRKNINYDYDDDDDDEERDNHRELEALKQQETRDSDAPVGTDEPAKISGSVVLLALQKASAQKTINKTKKKKKKVNKNTKEEDKPRRQGDDQDYSDVRPLCIKSDWKDRLDELETQLHQLIHNP